MLPRCVVDRMDVQLGCGRLPCQFTQTLHEFLLEIIGDVVLFTKKDDTAL
jgi:hypothetical protein